MTKQIPLMQPSPEAQAAWDEYEKIKRELEAQHPEIQWGKMCLAYCGDDQCDCGASIQARAIEQMGLRKYRPDNSGRVWWCNSHERRATYLLGDTHTCEPGLGGIMIPCRCVDLTDLADIQ